MAFLLVKQGEYAGQRMELSGQKQTIGRSKQCDIRLPDSSVSRNHAVIYAKTDGAFAIEDVGSTYGTFFNGKKLKKATLTQKTSLQFGAVLVEFYIDDAEHADPSRREVPSVDTADLPENYTILHVLSEQDAKSGIISDQEDPDALNEKLHVLEKRLNTAYEISAIISSTYELSELFKKIFRSIFDTIKVERVSILLVNEDTGELIHQASMDLNEGEEEALYSSTIVKKVIKNGQSLLLRNAQTAAEFDTSHSIFAYNIRSAMCVPLRTREKIIGVINVDASGESFFTQEDLQLLTLIGNQAGVVIQNARLIEENIKAERLAAVGQTVASLAHCIKNILQGIKGGSSLVDEGLNTGNSDMLGMAWTLVKSSQQRISELVLNMLDYSKERKPAYHRADLHDHMQNIFELMRDRAKEKNVSVEFVYNCEKMKVECDSMGIYRATLNLMTNAIDAVEKSQGNVMLHVSPSQNQEYLLIKVSDDGTGIPPEVKDKLFEAFHSTKDSKGTGLGLAVSKKIVTEHKGDIIVDTKLGEGTTFTIKLPVNRPPEN